MVTGSSKVWVGIDDQPIELKKSNDGSLELNEWECICAADTLNVGDYCLGAPLISPDFGYPYRSYSEPKGYTSTNSYILIYYSTLIKLVDSSNPMRNTISEYSGNSFGGRYTYIKNITSRRDGIKVEYHYDDDSTIQDRTAYYDLSYGNFEPITETDYNNIPNVYDHSLSEVGRLFNNGSEPAYSKTYSIRSAALSITDSVETSYGHTILAGKANTTYCGYYPLLYAHDSIFVLQQESSTSNDAWLILQYSAKLGQNMIAIGPKQVAKWNSQGRMSPAAYYNHSIAASSIGIVTAKIDSTHVIVGVI